ncbi:MAG: carboxypeptidase-like regulatory domain-containing protein [Chitinophagaceae bacterium]
MKQKIQLHIPEPCHENWNNMSATQQGRFCLSCQKEVIDFSVMTDKEILTRITSASANMCGRVADGQLRRDLITPVEPRKTWWRYGMGLAASLILLTSKGNGQVKAPKDTTVCLPPGIKAQNLPAHVTVGMVATVKAREPVRITIQGQVVDENNNPVPFASVQLKDGASGVAADEAGNFSIHAKASPQAIELLVSSVGYEQKTIAFKNGENIISIAVVRGAVQLKAQAIVLTQQRMGEVVVTRTAPSMFAGRAGGLVMWTKISRYEKAIASFKDAAGINEIKIYPNPILINSRYTISLHMKDMGWYTLQFTDAAGRIIESRQINITAAGQLEKCSGSMFTGKGIYFVSASRSNNKKMYTTKLLVQ